MCVFSSFADVKVVVPLGLDGAGISSLGNLLAGGQPLCQVSSSLVAEAQDPGAAAPAQHVYAEVPRCDFSFGGLQLSYVDTPGLLFALAVSASAIFRGLCVCVCVCVCVYVCVPRFRDHPCAHTYSLKM